MYRIAPAALAFVVILSGSAEAQRTVEGMVLRSDTLPATRIQFDASLRYAGGQSIMLGTTTHAEQHFFLDDSAGTIRRLYWMQFEGQGPGGRPYNYSADSTVAFGPGRWHVNYRFYPPSGFSGPSGSDGAQALRFLEQAGFRLGPNLARVRLVWLLDQPPMNELMVIYLEDLGPHGLSLDGLQRDPARWARFREGLLARAIAGMRFPSPAGDGPDGRTAPTPCADSVRQALGGYVGDYDVVALFRSGPGTWDSTRATASIAPDLGGCVLREVYRGTRYGESYESLALWGANGWPDGRIQRFFTHSRHGIFSLAAGGLRNDTLVLEERAVVRGQAQLEEDRFTLPSAAGFSLLSRRTTDDGASWTVTLQADYRRRP